MAALLQPNQVGIREDLADFLAVVDAKSTPLTSMIPKGKDLGNMRFDWQVDNYSAPNMGGVVDGTDLSSYTNASANRLKLSNYAQVFRRDFRVGFIAETQNVAGINSETARSLSKRMLEIKRDMEATMALTNQAAQADNGTLAYLTSSLGNWVDTNGSSVGQATSTYATPSGSKYTGTAAALTETNVQDILTSIYGQTGQIKTYDGIVGTTLKRAFTSLTTPATTADATNQIAATAVRTFNQDFGSDTYTHSIDVFQGDFGTITLHPSTFIGYNNAGTWTAQAFRGYVIPSDMLELRYAKLPEVKDLPDSGGGPAKLIQAIAGLVCKNPLGFGYFKCSA